MVYFLQGGKKKSNSPNIFRRVAGGYNGNQVIWITYVVKQSAYQLQDSNFLLFFIYEFLPSMDRTVIRKKKRAREK